MSSIETLREKIRNSDNIVFLGGAGVSTESGIPDFRSATGLYSKERRTTIAPEEMISYSFFMRHMDEFYDYYKKNLIYSDAKPNKAHLALAKLEEDGRVRAVITQNIDGLHQLAGSKNVLELHGSVHRNYCMSCGTTYGLDHILKSEGVPKCTKCGGVVRPDVVLYEEGLDMNVLNRAVDYISKADIMIIGGTSLNVYPAAGLVEYFRGDSLVLINKSETNYDHRADFIFRDSIGSVMEELAK
ncbi:MAG: NAD-dependent protein deacylase [Gudongella sp.]|jgi:NAD-dependent deacetylase|nr:NAD-dependent protein deacylase [Gudongella sp.]